VKSSFPIQILPDGVCIVYPSPVLGNRIWVAYNMPQSGTATLLIYNERGDLAAQAQEVYPKGFQQTLLDITPFWKGVYTCRVILTLDSGGTKVLKSSRFLVLR
jgi:hypothetical protein